MVAWHVDEGLAELIGEWKRAHPGAVVGTIAGGGHVATWPATDHAPEPQGSAPGQDAGEVDAADFMQGAGVTDADLDELAEGLVRSRDPRILYVIRNRRIISSVVQPWVWRPYKGTDPHTEHLHLSVNDKFDDNTSDWHWEALVARTLKFETFSTRLAPLQLGDDDDMWSGYNHVARAQVLANWLDGSVADLDVDGVYGPNTARKFAKIHGGDGKHLTVPMLKKMHGLD